MGCDDSRRWHCNSLTKSAIGYFGRLTVYRRNWAASVTSLRNLTWHRGRRYLALAFVAASMLASCRYIPSDWFNRLTPTPNAHLYVVQQGDTLLSIARAYGTSVETLIDLNTEKFPELSDTTNRSELQPGSILIVPPVRRVTP